MITKTVIPVAGYGTRMLPACKTIPKNILNILNKPAIQYIAESASVSGIKDIVLITSRECEAIENHFDYYYELEEKLRASGKTELYNEIRAIPELANFIFIRQKQTLGNGHAVLCAKPAIENNNFIMSWGDDFIDSGTPWFKQMSEAFEKYQVPIVCGITVDDKDVSKYGIMSGQKISDRLWKIDSVIEKPDPKEVKSRLAMVTGFAFTPEIFDILEDTKPSAGGEIWLTDAVSEYLKKKPMYALEFNKNERYDFGNLEGYLRAVVHFAEKNPETKGLIRRFLEDKEDQQKINL